MILTEDEAQGKACCKEVSHVIDEDGMRATSVCIVSSCMAWRWYDKPYSEDDRRGYCGLAGSVEYTIERR